MSGRRGEHRDPIGSALTALWALGHAIVLGLLPVLIQHHNTAGAMTHARAAETASDVPSA